MKPKKKLKKRGKDKLYQMNIWTKEEPTQNYFLKNKWKTIKKAEMI